MSGPWLNELRSNLRSSCSNSSPGQPQRDGSCTPTSRRRSFGRRTTWDSIFSLNESNAPSHLVPLNFENLPLDEQIRLRSLVQDDTAPRGKSSCDHGIDHSDDRRRLSENASRRSMTSPSPSQLLLSAPSTPTPAAAARNLATPEPTRPSSSATGSTWRRTLPRTPSTCGKKHTPPPTAHDTLSTWLITAGTERERAERYVDDAWRPRALHKSSLRPVFA
eukprot:gnl/Spiro4/2867_TR1410_c0_g1_i1.p1 gnl/Spiro4/2867_TR1410_c0_g1~~gnl/Spiro4/2867_TR1410_c0_g1_i1.p1  ORF type:complete len:230 (+),score=42.11 gnl/Spiro4/2867_TR1410_c0_g1_i1:31-690(+)